MGLIELLGGGTKSEVTRPLGNLLGSFQQAVDKAVASATHQETQDVGISDRLAALVLGITSGAPVACGNLDHSPAVEGLKQDGGINISPRADVAAGADVEDKGALPISLSDFIEELSGAGDRYMDMPIETVSGNLYGEGLNDLAGIEIMIESDTQLVDAGMSCKPGMVSLYLPPEEATLDIVRLPVTIIGYKITDKVTGQEYTAGEDFEVAEIGATCIDPDTGEATISLSANPIAITIPKEIYENGRLDIKIEFDVQIDGTNAIPSHEYGYYLRVRMEAR